jgi:hypothetical protein
MKRIIYAVSTTACLALLHGTPHSAEVLAPTSLSPLTVAQSQGGPGHTEEIQERVASVSEPPHLPPRGTPTPFPGEFAIRKGTFLTAVGGGGRTTDTFHTDLKDATKIGSWEKFKLWFVPATGRKQYAIQTTKGFYVTAVGGGSQVTEPALQTNRTQIQDWEKFRLY